MEDEKSIYLKIAVVSSACTKVKVSCVRREVGVSTGPIDSEDGYVFDMQQL